MNPYEVLGVSPDADEETIKKAYRSLVKKYHPDKYINNPLADLAAEKMKEINKAYDMLVNKQTTEQSKTQWKENTSYSGTAEKSFAGVRSLIAQNRLMEALVILNSLPKTDEWYYLNGIICLRRGWYEQALTNLKQACAMNPGNAEYRAALDNISNRNTSYRKTATVSAPGLCLCPLGICACMRCC